MPRIKFDRWMRGQVGRKDSIGTLSQFMLHRDLTDEFCTLARAKRACIDFTYECYKNSDELDLAITRSVQNVDDAYQEFIYVCKTLLEYDEKRWRKLRRGKADAAEV